MGRTPWNQMEGPTREHHLTSISFRYLINMFYSLIIINIYCKFYFSLMLTKTVNYICFVLQIAIMCLCYVESKSNRIDLRSTQTNADPSCPVTTVADPTRPDPTMYSHWNRLWKMCQADFFDKITISCDLILRTFILTAAWCHYLFNTYNTGSRVYMHTYTY